MSERSDVVTLKAVVTVISHCQGLLCVVRGGRGVVREVAATSVHPYSAFGLATLRVLYCKYVYLGTFRNY